MASFPRTLSLAVFRVHIENGLSVAFGVGLTGLVVGAIGGFEMAMATVTGAVAVSISDQPDPLSQKPWILGFALAAACFFSALSSFSRFVPGGFLAATVVAALCTGLVSVYGKRALTLSMTGVLSFVFVMGERLQSPQDALAHFELFVLGAVLYTAYAGAFAALFDDRVRRLLLAEAMRAFADYLRAKAALFNPDSEGPAAFRALIDAHAALTDRLQAARDSLFARRASPMQLKRIDTLIALLDAFEVMLSSDADFELLRHSRRREIKWRMNALVGMMAAEVEIYTLALRRRHASLTAHRHEAEAAALLEAVRLANQETPEDPNTDYAFLATANKLNMADSLVAAIAPVLDRKTQPSPLASGLDLTAFRQPVPHGLDLLFEQFDLSKPAMRYAIRLALAMSAGLELTTVFPRFAHANWVLLTIALIMRANYSVTRRRRWDRVTGTLLGCAIAVAFLNFLPPALLLLAIVLAVGTSHAYGAVKYRITAVSASVSSLLLLHFAAPLLHPQFFERIVDTLIGAGLSWGFSYLLPNWEINDLPQLVRGLLAADAGFVDAALRWTHPLQSYRLARKKTMDAVAQLSGAIRRLADEPTGDRRVLASLNELLAANYFLASDLSSMPILMQVRSKDLDPWAAESEINTARQRALALFAAGGETGPQTTAPERQSLSALIAPESSPDYSMSVLRRRLAHIEYAAQKVARLAARPVIEEGPEH